MSEELFQSLIRDLEQQKPIRERLAALRGEKLDALKRETEEAIAHAKTESAPDREAYGRLREHMIDVTRDVLLSSLLEATEGIIFSRGVERRQETEKEQPRAQESAQSSASDQAPKESLNVFGKNPAPTATQKPAMCFREWVRSQRGQSAPAEGTWNKIVSWFGVQSPNPGQNYDENIWSKPKYWFAYGVYRLMDWWNGWWKKPAAAPEQKKQPEALPPAPTEPSPAVQQQQPAPTQSPAPQEASTAPSPTPEVKPQSAVPSIPTVQQTPTPAPSEQSQSAMPTAPIQTTNNPETVQLSDTAFQEFLSGKEIGKYRVQIKLPNEFSVGNRRWCIRKYVTIPVRGDQAFPVCFTDVSLKQGQLSLNMQLNAWSWVITLVKKTGLPTEGGKTLTKDETLKLLAYLATNNQKKEIKQEDAEGKKVVVATLEPMN